MKRRAVILQVDPAFHKMVKVSAARMGISIPKFTKHIAQNNNYDDGGMKFDFKI